MHRTPTLVISVALALLAAPAAAQEEVRHEDAAVVRLPWSLPVESCQPQGGLKAWPPREDLPPTPFQPGDSFGLDQLDVLKDFLPSFIWENRDRFFYEGMRLEIGSCFNDYGPPEFFRSATARYAGQARVSSDGGLVDYTAGLPFPPERIQPDDPQVGLQWAWNFEMRYRGAGFWGEFRTSDMVGRDGRAEPFVGEIFQAQTAFRADRSDDRYTAPGAKHKHWVGGGLLLEPFDARHYAWRQYRDINHLVEENRSDDLHAYLPNLRRVRRVPSAGVEGIYMPSFSVGVSKPSDVDGSGGSAAIASSITTKRSGFEGLEMRPLLYQMRVLGVQDVLTPINARTPAYPVDPEREFGPWGLSFASDRWDLRRAIVLEGRAKVPRSGEQVQRFVQYLDVQTLAPLYYASWDSREEQIDVGMHVGRWSEEREDYRPWPKESELPIRVIDPVGASFANLLFDGGWRRESWEVVSTPPSERELKRELSVNNLSKRR
jgi:hypothetical protein